MKKSNKRRHKCGALKEVALGIPTFHRQAPGTESPRLPLLIKLLPNMPEKLNPCHTHGRTSLSLASHSLGFCRYLGSEPVDGRYICLSKKEQTDRKREREERKREEGRKKGRREAGEGEGTASVLPQHLPVWRATVSEGGVKKAVLGVLSLGSRAKAHMTGSPGGRSFTVQGLCAEAEVPMLVRSLGVKPLPRAGLG